jgi:phosphatidylserine/phosphatidylglycerophosphate/cardiolipin synthase-like enzyme
MLVFVATATVSSICVIFREMRKKRECETFDESLEMLWKGRKEEIGHDRLLTEFEDALPRSALEYVSDSTNPEIWDKLYDSSRVVSESITSTIDRFVWLADGKEAWDVRVALIDAAKTSIRVQYAYIYLDFYGYAFCERLVSAAKRGVTVEVIIDEFGAESFRYGGENPRHRCRDTLKTTWDDMMSLLKSAGIRVTVGFFF